MMKAHALRPRPQGGGTVVGLIIGLIIGLGIAVGVAMTIKNTSLPFTNKLAKQAKLSEPSAGQISDPNKPIYGNRDAVKQAARDVPRKTEESSLPVPPGSTAPESLPGGAVEDPAVTVAREASKEAAKEVARLAKLAKLDSKPPVVDKSNAEKTAAAILNADNTDERFTYFLQAGAFLEQSDAENAKAKLALMGVGASIAERKSDNGTLYRVRVGPFGQVEAMNKVRGRLSDNGVDVAVIRVPK